MHGWVECTGTRMNRIPWHKLGGSRLALWVNRALSHRRGLRVCGSIRCVVQMDASFGLWAVGTAFRFCRCVGLWRSTVKGSQNSHVCRGAHRRIPPGCSLHGRLPCKPITHSTLIFRKNVFHHAPAIPSPRPNPSSPAPVRPLQARQGRGHLLPVLPRPQAALPREHPVPQRRGRRHR